jgi:radical SAM superfamily enzyme YgiQ (UPF0313 family)
LGKINAKIMLINTLPKLDYWEVIKEPLLGLPMGLLSIGTVLEKQGVEVVIVDPVVDRNYLEIIEQNLEGCLFVGVSAMTSGIASALEISKHVKELKPNIPVVWGGIHPTLFPEQTLKHHLVDIIGWGEGEKTCLELVDCLKSGKNLTNVKGVGFKKNGKIIQTPPEDFVDVNDLPTLNYSLIDINKYLYRNLSIAGFQEKKEKVFVINTGRGCPYKCTFCINTHPSQKFRLKSFDRIKAELEQIVTDYEPDVIHFQDDLFFADKKRFLDFLGEYTKKNYQFKWFGLTRANYFSDEYLSDDVVRQMKSSCLWLGLGVESGSEEIRRLLRKQVEEEQVWNAVFTLSKYHMPTGYAFMIGLPYENEGDYLKTVDFMLKIKKIHVEAQFTYQLYRPYPGCELYDLAIKKDYKSPKRLEEWALFQDKETGYTTIEAMPWIKSPNLVRYLVFLMKFVNIGSRRFKGLKKIGPVSIKALMIVSYCLRRKFNFYKGLWEVLLLKKLFELYYRMYGTQ